MSWLDALLQGYKNIASAGTLLAQARNTLNFVGATVADNPTTGQTDVTISALSPSEILLGEVGHRLTLVANTPVPGVDTASAGTLYSTPYTSNRVGLISSGVWTVFDMPQKSLVLSGVVSGSVYDVCWQAITGVPTLVLSAAWADDVTPTDSFVRLNGVWVMDSDPTKRHAGTIKAIGTNLISDSSTAGRYVSNRYNREPLTMYRAETTDHWDYNAVVPNWRAANNSATNALKYVACDASIFVDAHVRTLASSTSGSNQDCAVGVGVDSTTVNSAQGVNGTNALGSGAPAMAITADYEGRPGLGAHKLYWLEAGAQSRFYGLNALVNRGSIFGTVWG